MPIPELNPAHTPAAAVETLGANHWGLSCPYGDAGAYRLAQLDDYRSLPRARFPWNPPVSLRLQARASSPDIPGTWGFGFWNDPFSSFFFGGGRALPALPNAAWFFFASAPNHLSLRDDQPGAGALAMSLRSPGLPAWLFAPAVIGLPFLALRPAARLARKLASIFIRQDTARLALDPTAWHAYALRWEADRVLMQVNGSAVFESGVSPRGPLGFVLWIDNQYAAWTPEGRLKYGTLAAEPQWIEVKDLEIEDSA